MRRRVFVDPPVLCGHRGSGRGVVGGQPENTLASFRAAVAAGLSWVEVDARINADDVLVARHDPVVEDGRFISRLGTGETDRLGLMRVGDLLADLPAGIGVNVEIKTSLEDALRPRGRTTAALVADLLAAAGDSRPLLASSFDPAAILIVRERLPAVPIGLLTWTRYPMRKAIAAAAHLGADVVAPNIGSFAFSAEDRRLERDPAEAVRVAHDAGLEVVAWCPKPDVTDRLVAAGADCMIVDDAPSAAARRSAAKAAPGGAGHGDVAV